MNPPLVDLDEAGNAVPREVKASVCVITFNHAPYIRQALDSVLMQRTAFPFEILIGEDHSTDGTREICQEYAARHPDRIRLFLRHERDKIYAGGVKTGKFNARQTIGAARGEFIANLEGDDFWIDPLKLQRQVDFLATHPDCPICATRCLVMRDTGSTVSPRPGLAETTLLDHLRNDTIVNTCTLVYRAGRSPRDVTWGHGTISGDWVRMVATLMDGSRCAILPEVTAVYRVHAGGMWNGQVRDQHTWLEHRLKKLTLFRAIAPAAFRDAVETEIAWIQIRMAIRRPGQGARLEALLKAGVTRPRMLWRAAGAVAQRLAAAGGRLGLAWAEKLPR